MSSENHPHAIHLTPEEVSEQREMISMEEARTGGKYIEFWPLKYYPHRLDVDEYRLYRKFASLLTREFLKKKTVRCILVESRNLEIFTGIIAPHLRDVYPEYKCVWGGNNPEKDDTRPIIRIRPIDCGIRYTDDGIVDVSDDAKSAVHVILTYQLGRDIPPKTLDDIFKKLESDYPEYTIIYSGG